MPPIKVANPKVSQELVEELKDEPAYQNLKAFSATHAFLRRLVVFSRDQEYAKIPAKVIKEQFDNYGVKYKPCLDALVKNGLVDIDLHYIVGAKPRGYKLTEKGARLMYQSHLRYLRDMFTDPRLKRQIQKRESYHRNKEREYKSDFLQHIHDGRMQYQYSQDAVNLIEQSDWEMLTKVDALESLTDFSERHFTELKHNESDNRVWNEFVGMKSDLRRFFNLGDLKYKYVMDIRSCHPLFFAYYLVHEAKKIGYKSVNPMMPGDHQLTIVQLDSVRERERSERLLYTPSTTTSHSPPNPTFPNNPTTLSSNNIPLSHYDGGNSDILVELKAWNDFFTNPNVDPKTVLQEDLGYTRETAKAALNQTINGSKKYRKFISWFKERFPLLHGVWERTLNREVGVNISFGYETQLMQDKGLYRLATKLGLHLTYEYDGCGIMCKEDDEQALAKIQQLVQHVQDLSEKKWGIRPVLVVKTAQGEQVKLPDKASEEKLTGTAEGASKGN
jgi:hypothetical protein